ncbi:MAG: CapA family protein [Betaproteobacteria bacterium]|nr:MAG: CapA family protein [Betaproteobacteria bacterium]
MQKFSPTQLVFLVATVGCFTLGARAYAMQCGASPSFSESRETFTIKAVGDMVLGTTWPEDRIPPDVEHRFFDGVAQTLSGSDIVFGNLEGALTNSAETTKDPSRGTQYAFRMPPRFAGVLRDAGFNVLSLANNHSSDFGLIGLEDTVNALQSQGILAVGLQDEIVYQEIRGSRIAWIGFSYLGLHNNIHDMGEVARLVSEADRKATLVIVTFHGGAEGSDALRVSDSHEKYLGENRGNLVRFARTAVESGADLVLGHGPHVLRGVECYWQKLIVYSLGNFVGYQAFSTKRAAAISVILDVTLDEDGWLRRVEFHPVRFTGEHLPTIDSRRRALYLLNDLSQKPPLEIEGKILPDSTRSDASYRAYRRWLQAADLETQLAD